MELGCYFMDLHLSLITTLQSLSPLPHNNLKVIPADIAGFGGQTDFIRFPMHTNLEKKTHSKNLLIFSILKLR